MIIEKNDILKFDDKEYLVIDTFNKNNDTYLYLINNDNFEDDIAISKIINNEFTCIYDDDEYEYVLNKLFLDLKDNIISIATNE